MKLLSKVKNAINNVNAKLSRGTKIGICGIIAATLILCIAGAVNYNNNQKETAVTATKETEVDLADKHDHKNTAQAVDVKKVETTSTPEPTVSSQTEEKKEAAKATPAPKAETKTNSQQNQKKNTNQSGSNKNKSCKVVNHPAVTHQEPVYTIVHHDAVTHEEPVYTQVQTGTKTVVDQAAYDETVEDGAVAVCGMCGAKFRTGVQIEDHISIVHDCVGRYWVEPAYKTVHHDAVTHQEPVYENQQTGTKTVVDKAAYDEKVQTGTKTVTDKAAWQETVCQ